MSPAHLSLPLLLIAPVALGCAGNVSGSPGSGDVEATATHGLVVIQRTVDAVDGVHAEASARFVSVPAWSSMSDAFRAIGAALDLPEPGTCVSQSHPAGGTTGEVVPVVELSDVGSVVLEVAGGATRLVPRQLPDVTDVVSGLVYARTTEATFLPAAAPYVMHVGGASGLGAFDVEAVAPGDPSDVRVAGEDSMGPLTVSGPFVEISWSRDGSDDVVFTDVQPAGVRCVFSGDQATRGDGLAHGTVSTSLLDEAGTLVVHRLRREPMVAPGIADGEVRFDFARSVPYVR
jgi:acyl-coenzyme A thioesterase PaaI-like protein